MHTLWAAKTTFDEELHGSLTEGKFADFVVLGQNPLEVDKSELRDIVINSTYLRGKEHRKGQKYPLHRLIWNIMKNTSGE